MVTIGTAPLNGNVEVFEDAIVSGPITLRGKMQIKTNLRVSKPLDKV